MNATINSLKQRLDNLVQRATDKRRELTDDTATADAERIEREHDDITRQASGIRAEIDCERGRLAVLYTDLAIRGGQDAEFAKRHIQRETSEKEYRTMIIDKLADESDRVRILPHVASEDVTVGRDETDTRRAALRDAIVARMERATAKPGTQVTVPDHARAYASMGLVEIAAESIRWRGPLRTARQVSDMLERAFHTTSDFPAIFMGAMNMRLLARYQAAMPTYRYFCAPDSAIDFRTKNVVRAGDFPALQPVSEAGEIKSGTFSESKEEFRVYPYAVQFAITRQMILNDSLRAIDQMIGSYGDRVTDWENVKIFDLLNQDTGNGPVLLGDNKRMFHADHGNKAGSGAAIDVTSVGVGRAAMMKQKSLDGILLNLTPAVILTGPDKITSAEQLVTSITPAQTSNSVPESLRKLKPVGDGNISGNGWYMFADPAVAPCFHYGYLEGFEGPRLATDEPFGVQGLRVKLEHDFGVSGVDYRGGYKNAGA